MNNSNKISVIVVVCNQLALTKLSVKSILDNTKETPFEFIIIDNGSASEIAEYFDSLKDSAEIKYIRNEKNIGTIKAINQGIRSSNADYIVVIHNDVIILEKGWLSKIISIMERDPKIGVAGLAGRREIYKTGCVNEDSLKHNLQNEDLNPPMKEEVSEVAVIDGLCFVIKRELLKNINGLDEVYGYMHCYDLDLSLVSIALGFKNVVINIKASHLSNGGATRRSTDYKSLVKDDYGLLKKNCKILQKKWKRILPLKI